MKKAKNQYVVLFSTTGSMEEAETIAEHLVSNHLVACVNILPSIRSIYWWNNRLNKDTEVLMIIKTEDSRIAEIEESIRKLHSYDTPELIALPIQYGIPEYLQWMNQALSSTDDAANDS